MIALPALAFFLLFLILRKKQIESRRALLVASTFWGAGLVLMTELLSVFQLITRSAVTLSWLAVNAVCLILYLKLERPALTPDLQSQPEDPDSGSESLDTVHQGSDVRNRNYRATGWNYCAGSPSQRYRRHDLPPAQGSNVDQ